MLGRIVEHAPLAVYVVCGVLFAAAVAGALLLASARMTTDAAIEAVSLVNATQSALTSELGARESFDRRPAREAALAQTEAQRQALDALRQLATAPHSPTAHHIINDETIVLHEGVAGILGQPASLIQVRRSLDRAAAEIVTEARGAAGQAHMLQSIVLVAGPVLFALGFGAIAALCGLTFLAQARRERRLDDAAAAVTFYERRFRSLIHNAVDMVLLCDASGRVIYQSPSAESGWGYAAGSLLSNPILAITHPDERNAILELGAGTRSMVEAASGGPSIDARLRDGFGQWRDAELTVSNLLANPDVQAIVFVARDIGHRKARERALVGQALYDPSTGLPNLLLLEDRLEQALLRARRRKKPVGLIFARLAAVDVVVDGMPDPALETVGRLRMCMRTEDTIARLHDGTLAVVLGELEDDAAARLVAERITAECSRVAHRDLPGAPAPLAIGIAFGDPMHATVATLMQEANLALHRALPGKWVLFEPDMRERALDRTELASDLRMADLRTEMQVTYQPVMRMADPILLGFEATVTWVHPSLGAIDAARFASLADETGLSIPIGRWVLEECCRQVADWQKQGRLSPPLSVGIKLSPRQFHSASLEADVGHALDSAGMAPECLILEISDAALLNDFEGSVASLWALRRRGVRIAIDGLGSGYSALPLLAQLPIDVLKLNIGGLGGESDRDAMDKACAMTAMALSLDMEVAAAGVETVGQAEQLRAWGCEFGHGSLYQASMAADQAEKMVLTVSRSRIVGNARTSTTPLRRPSPGKGARSGLGPDWPDSASEAEIDRPGSPRPGPGPRQQGALRDPAIELASPAPASAHVVRSVHT